MPGIVAKSFRLLRVLAAPALVFLIIIVVTLGLHGLSRRSITFNIEQATRDNCYKVVNLLQANLRERMMSVRQLANFFRITESVAEADFRGQSRFVMTQAPEIIAIVTTDAKRNVQWVEAGENQIGPDHIRAMMMESAIEIAVEEAVGSREYYISEMFSFLEHGDCFAILIPYERDATLSGFMFGIFSHQRLLNSLLLPELQGDFKFELRQANRRVLDSYLFSAATRPEIRMTERGEVSIVEDFFHVGPQMWAVKIESSGYARGNPAYFTSDMILILGGILAFLLSSFTYFQQARLIKFQSEAYVSRDRLASASLSLAQIQENLDLILNNVKEAIILYDEEFHPLQANVEFKTTFGATRLAEMFEDSEEHHRAMAACFKNDAQYWSLMNALREKPEAPVTDTLEALRENESVPARHYQRRATSVTRTDGSRRGYLVIYQDITESRSIEKLKEDFLSSVTHDLRTPLASIKGFAETMMRDIAMDETTRNEFLAIIRDESERLEEMIEDLLDLRRMEEGRFDLRPASFGLKQLLEEIVRGVKPMLEAGGLRVEIAWTGDERGTIFGDVSKIGRALRNVLGNAIKYSPPEGKITIQATLEETRAEIEISDEGPGIPDAELNQIFEKFYRGARHVRRTKGTGLGLAIVKHIIESHGGVVTANNRPDKGATLRLVLPRRMEFWEDRMEPPLEWSDTSDGDAGAKSEAV